MAEITPTVKFEKPALPTLWLDTSVVIKLTKLEKGEALQDIEVQRCKHLRSLVHDLTLSGKLLCPESDQEEEYAAERMDDDISGMFAGLSLGISLAHRQGIYDQHVFKGMEAYAKNLETIFLPSRTYFHGDPVRRLEEARRERFIVSIAPLKSPEILRRRAKSKNNVSQGWERLRRELVARGQTYEAQLAVEQRGDAYAIYESVRKFETSLISSRPDFWGYMATAGPLHYRHYWLTLKGEPPDWKGVFRFFASSYFAELPIPYISSRLIAELLTGNESIAPSDPMDVDLLSVALPVADHVLTDRRMELRVKKLGLDAKCGTEVYSMSTIDTLFDRLE